MHPSRSPQWYPYHANRHAALSAHLRGWLLHAGSFMERLKEHAIYHSKVQVLQQGWQVPFPNEREVLKMGSRNYALIREVKIFHERNVWMIARTVFPRETLTGKYQQLARLKNRSLGSVLFKEPHLQRSEFEIARLQRGMEWFENAIQYTRYDADTLWARRSVFYLQERELLLTEVFLPDIEAII